MKTTKPIFGPGQEVNKDKLSEYILQLDKNMTQMSAYFNQMRKFKHFLAMLSKNHHQVLN